MIKYVTILFIICSRQYAKRYQKGVQLDKLKVHCALGPMTKCFDRFFVVQ